ncbi:MAG: alkaline phosphatase [Clostridia bacterium]|nr:alkaline phosphatase [Clostridia bacterium]
MKRFFSKAIVFVLSITMLTTCFIGCAPTGGNPPADGGIKNVILVIGDGMGIGQINAGKMDKANDVYAFLNWTNARVNTSNATGGVTDSAAGGTAIATGTLTTNDYVGLATDGETELETIMDVAKALNKSTGIVTTDYIYEATPASFSAHAQSREDIDTIIESQITSSNVDIFCGKYSDECADYEYDIEENGYAYCESFQAIDSTLDSAKQFWSLKNYPWMDGLKTAVEKVISVLEKDNDGFVLVVEQADIDKYCHENNLKKTAQCVQSLNNTVNAIMSWLGNRNDTAVIVTADHETGGLSVRDSYAEGYKSDWTTESMATAYYRFESGNHTSAEVGFYIYGATPKFEDFATYKRTDLIKNKEIYQILKSLIEDKD